MSHGRIHTEGTLHSVCVYTTHVVSSPIHPKFSIEEYITANDPGVPRANQRPSCQKTPAGGGEESTETAAPSWKNTK